MDTMQFQVNHICRSPLMYVAERGFGEVAAWLSGYSAGITECGSQQHVSMNAFRDWLSERMYESEGMERNFSWSSYIMRICKNDEDEAFVQLPLIYAEFVEGKQGVFE